MPQQWHTYVCIHYGAKTLILFAILMCVFIMVLKPWSFLQTVIHNFLDMQAGNACSSLAMQLYVCGSCTCNVRRTVITADCVFYHIYVTLRDIGVP